MTILDQTLERYHRDAAFQAVVDALQKVIVDLHLTPSEVREAAMLACYLVESRRAVPHVPLEPKGPYR